MNKVIIETTLSALKHNHFDVFFAANTAEAREIFFRDIFPALPVKTVSWGDSETMTATGILEELRRNPEISVIKTFGPEMSRAQKLYWRRQALHADLFLTGCNARESGHGWKPYRRNSFRSGTRSLIYWHQQNHSGFRNRHATHTDYSSTAKCNET